MHLGWKLSGLVLPVFIPFTDDAAREAENAAGAAAILSRNAQTATTEPRPARDPQHQLLMPRHPVTLITAVHVSLILLTLRFALWSGKCRCRQSKHFAFALLRIEP